ncbi:MAG: hypothetical protein MCSN_1630 [Candidatus Microsyncoccus archaeolyticus]|jgi:hypothetical protein|nr:MAG: hypothetical protein MCSN_1630 [Candidatus Parcubacteria bacterium]
MATKNTQKLPYLKDFGVYALWKYLNGDLTGRKVFQFADLQAPQTSELIVANFIADLFDRLGITLEKPIFNKEIYWQFYSKSEDAGKAKKFLKILDDNFNVAELKKVVFLLGKYGALEFIEFEKNLAKKNRDKLTEYFDFYIKQFINDNLAQDDSNYLKFENQQQKTLEKLNEYRTKYGNDFVLKSEPINSEFSPEHDTYLFIHSIVALEKLGKIKVEKAWYYDDVAPDKQTDDFKIKLAIAGPEAKDISRIKLDPMLKTENGIGYFKFYKEGPKIEIGKTDTRKYRLLLCLLDTLGSARTIDSVFEAIKISRDKSDARLNDSYLSSNKKLEVIQFTMKELQKIKGLTGKITLEFPHGNRTVLLKLKS